MDLINAYFQDLIFSFVETKQGYAIYAVKISGRFGAGIGRYIILFVPSTLSGPKKARIHELPWWNLQTRELRYSYRIPEQRWTIRTDLIDPIFTVRDRNKSQTIYGTSEIDFPFDIILLHQTKKNTKYQYRTRMSLTAIFETYSSLFNYVGSRSPVEFTTPSTLPPLVNSISSYTLPFSMPFSSNSNEEIDDSFEVI
jgi:hypothetical protein